MKILFHGNKAACCCGLIGVFLCVLSVYGTVRVKKSAELNRWKKEYQISKQILEEKNLSELEKKGCEEFGK